MTATTLFTNNRTQAVRLPAELRMPCDIKRVNDLHIAAHARSAGLVVVTNSVREFESVPALAQESWVVGSH